MHTVSGFSAFVLLEPLACCALFGAVCDVTWRWLRAGEVLTLFAAVFAFGVLGYACFWLAYANYSVFSVTKIALWVLAIAYLAAVIHRQGLRHLRWLAEPL